MYPLRRVNDSVHWYMSELTSRVVAESGIPSDRHHLGKILLQSLKDDPDFILQIDGATGDTETNGSVLERSVRCATALKNLGVQRGDVITLMAPNHTELAIPFYAALYLGVIVSPIDTTLGVNELRATFKVTTPKVIFCQCDRASEVRLALIGIDSEAFIVTFAKGDYSCSFPEFLDTYGDKSPTVSEFKPTDFNPRDTIALLIATSGSTGLPKSAAATHMNLAITAPYDWVRHTQFPTPTKMVFIISQMQWLSAIAMYLGSPIMRFTRLQSSQSLTQQHTYDLINIYKPTFMIVSPTFLATLITPDVRHQCDFTCYETIVIGGSAVTADLLQEIKIIAPNTEVLNGYGMSEVTSLVFINEGLDPGSAAVGKPMGCLQYRLIDVETQEDIHEPNKNGELWVKGPGIIQSYYKNPDASTEAFTEDGWFKTGDIFYRDQNYNFFFVERFKLLLKYMNHQISPVELEKTIRRHPGVMDVAVVGIPGKCGDLPVACVVRRPGTSVTAEDIKQLVKDELADSKQLRGGVIFLDTIPQTASTKIHRSKLKEIAIQMLTDQN